MWVNYTAAFAKRIDSTLFLIANELVNKSILLAEDIMGKTNCRYSIIRVICVPFCCWRDREGEWGKIVNECQLIVTRTGKCLAI